MGAAELVEPDCRSLAMMNCCLRGLGESTEPGARMLMERVERVVAQDKSNGAALAIGAGALAEIDIRLELHAAAMAAAVIGLLHRELPFGKTDCYCDATGDPIRLGSCASATVPWLSRP